jgi:DNA mismatch endonuclease (patch repair protein)
MGLPYPNPTSVAVSQVMRGNRGADTRPEIALRSALHGRGLRFRNGLKVAAGGIQVRPDVVFSGARVAVFVDGCFWHSCPLHGVSPRRNVDYWQAKLERNRVRDERVNEVLTSEGWAVVRVWEHVPSDEAAAQVVCLIRREAPQRPAQTQGY